ncbi:MAG TPA: SRPBCC family protein [Gammaproteobacteria bacterium]|nr:SRPBCC family protein [Gammaproteobacteria bacterium]
MRILFAAMALAAAFSTAAAAEPHYVTIEMHIDVAKPAKAVWAKVGKYCDIAEWAKLDCKIASGNGGIGTVRSLAGGRVTEVLVGKTDLSYGYTQPAKAGQFYNLYHGYLEAKPLSATSSRLIYTLMYDDSNDRDEAAKQADAARRRGTFEAALKRMKEIAEADRH